MVGKRFPWTLSPQTEASGLRVTHSLGCHESNAGRRARETPTTQPKSSERGRRGLEVGDILVKLYELPLGS